MKFLCVECNEAMKFKEATPAKQGSITAIFACPDCCSEIALFLNPWESQLVKSLDVKLGGSDGEAEPMGMVRSFLSHQKEDLPAPEAPSAESTSEAEVGGGMGKCPFASVVNAAFEQEGKGEPAQQGAGESSIQGAGEASIQGAAENEMSWTDEALLRLDNIPSFVRPMAKAGIESFASENGHAEVDVEVMDAARGSFGM